MGQVVRQTKERPDAYWETLRERINAGKAVNVINKALKEQDVKPHALSTAIFVINKLLPSLQAVAVQVQQTESMSRHDIDALLLGTGLNPKLIEGFTDNNNDDNQEDTGELIDSVPVESDTPLPRD